LSFNIAFHQSFADACVLLFLAIRQAISKSLVAYYQKCKYSYSEPVFWYGAFFKIQPSFI